METVSKYSHVRLPNKIDRILFMLCEDLKTNRFFNKLHKAGLEETHRSDLACLVLEMVFKETTDDLISLYLNLLEKHSKKIKKYERTSTAKQALNFYIDLVIEKKRRSANMG